MTGSESELSLPLLEEGLAALSTLSEGEFRATLTNVLVDGDPALAFGRVGRLMAVWLKHPFAESFPYDPNAPGNWAKSQRAWEIHRPIANVAHKDTAARRDLLLNFAAEWGRGIDQLAEYNIFLSMCKRLRPVVCGESKVVEQADKIAADLRKKGVTVSGFSLNDMLGAASLTIATYLVQHVSFLSAGVLPLVSGATLLVCCFGH